MSKAQRLVVVSPKVCGFEPNDGNLLPRHGCSSCVLTRGPWNLLVPRPRQKSSNARGVELLTIAVVVVVVLVAEVAAAAGVLISSRPRPHRRSLVVVAVVFFLKYQRQ